MRRERVTRQEYTRNTVEITKAHRDRQLDKLKTERSRQVNADRQCQVQETHALSLGSCVHMWINWTQIIGSGWLQCLRKSFEITDRVTARVLLWESIIHCLSSHLILSLVQSSTERKPVLFWLILTGDQIKTPSRGNYTNIICKLDPCLLRQMCTESKQS